MEISNGRHGQQDVHHLKASAIILVGFVLLTCTACASSAAISSSASQNCGTITRRGINQATPTVDVTTAQNCFWQAYQHCQPATLTLHQMGVDTSHTYTLAIKPPSQGGTCPLSDRDDFFFASGGGRETISVYSCSGLTLQNGVLTVLNCGNDQNIVIRGSPPVNKFTV